MTESGPKSRDYGTEGIPGVWLLVLLLLVQLCWSILGDTVTGVGKATVTGICKADVRHFGDTVGCVVEIRTDDARCPVSQLI